MKYTTDLYTLTTTGRRVGSRYVGQLFLGANQEMLIAETNPLPISLAVTEILKFAYHLHQHLKNGGSLT